VSVTLRNNGETTWNPGTHFLGSQNPQDNFHWSLNRVALPAAVPPGGQVTFSFNVTAHPGEAATASSGGCSRTASAGLGTTPRTCSFR